MTTHSDNKCASTTATFGKHKSHSRKRPSQATNAKDTVTNRTATSGKLRHSANGIRQMEFGKQPSPIRQTVKLQTRNAKLVVSTLETDTFGKRNLAKSRATLGKRRNYKRKMRNIREEIYTKCLGIWTPMLCRISKFNFRNGRVRQTEFDKRPRHIRQTPKLQTGRGFPAKHDFGVDALSKDVKHERRLLKQQTRLCIEPRIWVQFGNLIRHPLT